MSLKKSLEQSLEEINAGYEVSGRMVNTQAKLKMPVSEEIEKAVLGAFLLDKDLFENYRSEILMDDFYITLHRDIFLAMCDIFQSHKCLDVLFFHDYFSKKKKLTDSLKEYLIQLTHDIFSVSLIHEYIPVLKEKSNLRKIISSAYSVISQCYSEDVHLDSSHIIDNAEKLFLDIVLQQKSRYYNSLDQSIKSVFSNIVSLHGHSGITGVPSGFSALDKITCGFQKGDLIVLAARPSMGKTAFSLCLARNAALQGFSVGYVSLEMESEQLAMRLLSLDARVCLNSLRSGLIDSEEWLRLTASAATVSDYSIFIDDTPAQSILDIKKRARKIFLEKNISMLVVDYLQLLHINRKFETRHHEVSEISRSLKHIAKELGIPIIALSQLSRQVESRHDKRPLLSDLRDSGAIEQDADLILFLYRDEVYNKETLCPGQVEVIVGKHRNGPTGMINLRYLREYTLFEE